MCAGREGVWKVSVWWEGVCVEGECVLGGRVCVPGLFELHHSGSL